MEPVKYQRSAPSVQLLNEIDILLTQVRLAELYLKQAQAVAADQVARIQERYESQLENLRAGFAKVERDLQERLDESDQQLRRKQAFPDESESELQKARANLAALQSRIAGLETDIAQAAAFKHETQRVHAALESEIAALRTELDNRDRLLAERQAELAASRQNLAQLETSQQMAEQAANSRWETAGSNYEAELAQLRATLADREHAFAERERELKISLERHTAEIAGLHSQLADGQSSVEQRTGELQEARSEIAALRERAAQLDLLQKQTERLLTVQAEQIRQRVRAELADLDARLASKDRELQAVRESAAELQASLNATIGGLRLELAEKLDLAEGRDKEVSDLREKTRGLLEQIAQLESSNRHLQAGAAGAVDGNREAYQAELAALRDQLRLRDEALTEQQTKSHSLEDRMTAQVQDFQNRWADQQRLLESRENALARAQEEFDNRLRQKNDALQAHQTRATELQNSLNSQVSALQTQLQEKQRQFENTTGESADLKASVSGLSEQVAQLASAAQDAESRGAAEAERARLEYRAELLDLHEELRGKQQALAEREARATELERCLGTHISDLETELAARQRLLEEREEALNTADSSAVALQERYTRLEASSRDAQGARAKDGDLMRATLEAELADLRSELQQKEWAIAQRQALIDNLGQGHKDRIRTLETKLAELRDAAENRATELDQASSERQQLLCRIGQLETAAADAAATAIGGVEQITQRYEIQMAALHVEIEQKTVALEEQGATRNDLERTYHAELSRLRAESQDKHRLLESRNEEVAGLTNAMDSLRERLTQLEATGAQAEQTGAEDQERLRVEYEAQLAALREELSQREPSDKDQGAMATAQTTTGQTFYSRSDRRWRSSGGWKRRWKT
jgi:chromosome segregation ATPase